MDDPNMTVMAFHDLLIADEASIHENVKFVNLTLAIDHGDAKRKKGLSSQRKGKG